MRTRTWRGPGSGSSIVFRSRTSGPPVAIITIASVCMERTLERARRDVTSGPPRRSSSAVRTSLSHADVEMMRLAGRRKGAKPGLSQHLARARSGRRGDRVRERQRLHENVAVDEVYVVDVDLARVAVLRLEGGV